MKQVFPLGFYSLLAVGPVLSTMNLLWFWKITKGLIKTISKATGKKKQWWSLLDMKKRDLDCIHFDLFMKKDWLISCCWCVLEAFSVYKTAFLWELYIHNLQLFLRYSTCKVLSRISVSRHSDFIDASFIIGKRMVLGSVLCKPSNDKYDL